MHELARFVVLVVISLVLGSQANARWVDGGDMKVGGKTTGPMDAGQLADLIDEIGKVDPALAADMLWASTHGTVGFATLTRGVATLEGVADHNTVAIVDGLSDARAAAVLAHEWHHVLYRNGQVSGTTANDRTCDEASGYAAELGMLEKLAQWYVDEGEKSPVKCADFYAKAKWYSIYASLCELGGGSWEFHDGSIPTGHCE